MGGGIIAIIAVFIVIPSESPHGGERYIGARIACEQALLFGRAKQASRERASEGLLSSTPRGFAARSCVYARLASLAQISRKLTKPGRFFLFWIHASLYVCKRSLELWTWLTCFSQWTQKGDKEFLKLLKKSWQSPAYMHTRGCADWNKTENERMTGKPTVWLTIDARSTVTKEGSKRTNDI